MSRNLRISLATETYFPQVNGVSRTLDHLVRHCSEQGDRVQLLLPRYAQNGLQLPSRVEKSEWRSFALPFYQEVVLPMVTVGMIERALNAFRPDLVHIATEGPLGWATLRAAKRLGLPVVSSYHTNFPQYLQTYNASFLEPLCWKYLRWFHNNTLATFCPSDSTRELLEEKGFKNVDIWSRGVDNHRFHPGKRDSGLRNSIGVGPGDILFCYAGRLANEKNLEMLFDAWRELADYENCHLLLIGDGPLRTRLEAKQLPRVIFAGYRYGEELATMYASSDLFVFPSLSETFGNVVLEAMASGLPVVAYDVQGPKDIVRDRFTGALVSEITANALATRMREILENTDLRRTMGRQARLYAEQQTWGLIMSGMRNRYRDIKVGSPAESTSLAQANKSAA
jgi:glycosyltransferase involved in cell wall biosynthesis